MTVSVDDGHPLDLRLAALLERHGMAATFYLPVTNREGPPVMSGAQARALAQHFEIGSHTRSHCFLAGADERTAWREIDDGKRALEDRLGMGVQGFCYPGGQYRRIHLQQVHAAGFLFARTTQNLCVDTGIDPLRLPVTAQFYPHPRTVWLRNFLSQRDWRRRVPALRVALREADWLARLARLLALAQSCSGVFHLWCHSLDLERLGLWDALDRFLAYAAQQVPPAQRLTNGALLGYATAPAVCPARLAIPPSPSQRADPRLPNSRPSTPSGNSAT